MEFNDTINIEKLPKAEVIGESSGESLPTLREVVPAVIRVRKIPRPPNAFMLYANTWRRKLAKIYPSESNKEISVRLGRLWKTMSQEEKKTYFNLAREVDAEHKRKYPDYVYNPKEARLRKALRDQGRLHRPRQKWKPSQTSLTPLQMLSQRAEEIRSQAMLQSYSDAFADVSYPQLTMPPAGDYTLVAPDQPWYNTYIHQGGLQNGGELFGRENKVPTEWQGYHSEQDQPYIPQQLNNNNSVSDMSRVDVVGVGESSYPGMLGQSMHVDASMMMSGHDQMAGTSQDPLMINQVHTDILTNGTENPHVEPPVQIKDEETLPRLEGPQATMVSNEGTTSEGGKDVLKLPGFHQTFGNITEIGRFSQHDDYFESRPSEVEQPKVSEPVEVAPKRKPRGRKRKQPEVRESYPVAHRGPGYPGDNGAVGGGGQEAWQYAPPRYCPSQQYWRPHPYYHHNHHHNHHHHYPPPPPQSLYHHHQPPPPPMPPQYNEYTHYQNYPPHYQANWPVNRDYMVHNYPSYV